MRTLPQVDGSPSDAFGFAVMFRPLFYFELAALPMSILFFHPHFTVPYTGTSLMKVVVSGGISVAVLCCGARVHHILRVVAEYVVAEASANASAGVTMVEWNPEMSLF